jgi:CHAT domain-containing protein
LSAQKSIRLINKGKYDKAEQLSLRELRKLKIEDQGRDKISFLPHEFTRQITAHHSLGLIYKLKGNFTAAELNFKRADSVYALFDVAIKKKIQSTSWIPTIRYSTYGIGIMQTKQDKRFYLRQSEQARIFMKLGELETSKSILDNTYRSMTSKYGTKASIGKSMYSGLGEYYSLTKQHDSSRHYYEKYILTLRSDPNYFDVTIKNLSEAYSGLAESYKGVGNIQTAIVASKKSHKYATHRFVKATDGKNYLGKIATANQLAELYRLQNEYARALKWNDKAIDLFNKRINVVSPEKLPVLATRGQIYWALSDTVNANKCFRELMKVFFSYTQNNFSYLSEPERAYFYRNNKHFLDLTQGYYHYLYFQKGYRDEYIAKSLYEIGLNNKGVLLNSSSKLLNTIYASGDDSLIKQYLDIRDLREKRMRYVQSGEMKEVALLEKAINQKEKALRNQLAIESEKYVTTEEVIHAIPDSTNLVDILKCKVYNLVSVPAGRDSVVSLQEINASRYLYFIFSKSGMTLIQNDISDKNLEGKFYKGYQNFAKNNLKNSEFYNAYFEPWKKHLSFTRLIVSGDGIYNLLNPEILFDGKEYLINNYTFLSVVSAKDLLKISVGKPVVHDITLIGWPDYSTHLTRYTDSPADLPGTAVEINGIKEIIPTSVNQYTYLRRSANEITIKDIPSTSILHFATHGFFDVSANKDPMYTSGLVLAISDSARQQEDGYLTAYEASNLELKKTFLVVLSACETGQGEFEEGEGVWGLQRAFQVAGVRYVVMSLFKVDDEVTSTLMKQFYANMIAGDTVLVAFRNAQMLVKKKFSKPVEWGAFVVKGI